MVLESILLSFFYMQLVGRVLTFLASSQSSTMGNSWEYSVLLLLFRNQVVSDSFETYGLWPTRLLCAWDFPGKNTGGGCHFLLQGIFSTQGSNPGFSHCGHALYHLSHQGSPRRHGATINAILFTYAEEISWPFYLNYLKISFLWIVQNKILVCCNII